MFQDYGRNNLRKLHSDRLYLLVLRSILVLSQFFNNKNFEAPFIFFGPYNVTNPKTVI